MQVLSAMTISILVSVPQKALHIQPTLVPTENPELIRQ
jgi:hypothetical protein